MNITIPCHVGMSIAIGNRLLPLCRFLISLNVKVDEEYEIA